jgi:hypothetical protein
MDPDPAIFVSDLQSVATGLQKKPPSPAENSSNIKYLYFSFFHGHFGLPGSGFPIRIL